jgi:hypothetical protein
MTPFKLFAALAGAQRISPDFSAHAIILTEHLQAG